MRTRSLGPRLCHQSQRPARLSGTETSARPGLRAFSQSSWHGSCWGAALTGGLRGVPGRASGYGEFSLITKGHKVNDSCCGRILFEAMWRFNLHAVQLTQVQGTSQRFLVFGDKVRHFHHEVYNSGSVTVKNNAGEPSPLCSSPTFPSPQTEAL